jgi:hypothetical protein
LRLCCSAPFNYGNFGNPSVQLLWVLRLSSVVFVFAVAFAFLLKVFSV